MRITVAMSPTKDSMSRRNNADSAQHISATNPIKAEPQTRKRSGPAAVVGLKCSVRRTLTTGLVTQTRALLEPWRSRKTMDVGDKAGSILSRMFVLQQAGRHSIALNPYANNVALELDSDGLVRCFYTVFSSLDGIPNGMYIQDAGWCRE